MKKFVSLLLCLALAMVPALCMAEAAEDTSAENYLSYSDPDGIYGFMYPSGYTVMDRDTITNVMDSAAKMDDEQLSSLATQYKDLIVNSNIVMLLSADMSTNINIVTQDVGVEMTPEQLLEQSPALESTLTSQISGLTITQSGQILEADTIRPLIIMYEYELAGKKLSAAQAYLCIGTRLFCATLTGDPDTVVDYMEDFGFVLGSIALK